MIKPKIIFLDIDGTLMNSRGEFSNEVRSALKRAASAGVILSFASGRPIFTAIPLLEELGITGLSSLNAGASIYDPVKKEIFQSWFLDRDKAFAFIIEAQKRNFFVEIHTEHTYYVEAYNEYVEIHLHYIKQEPTVLPFNQIPQTERFLKVEFMVHKPQEKALRDFIAEFPEFNYAIATGASHPDIVFCNATNPESSREKVFDTIISELNIDSSEVIAIGDSESDMAFISKAGMGVAMENASPTVKNVARFVTKHVDEDGAAYAIDRLVFGNGDL